MSLIQTRFLDRNDRNLKKILVVAVVVPALLLAALAGLFLWQLQRLMVSAKMVEHADRTIAELGRAEKLMVDMETGMRGFIFYRDPVFLEPFKKARAAIAPQWSAIETLTADQPDHRAAVDQARVSRDKWLAIADQRLETYSAPVTKDALHAKSLEAKVHMDNIRSKLGQLIESEAARRDRSQHLVEQSTRWTINGGLAIALFCGLLIAAWTRKQLQWVAQSYDRSFAEVRETQRALREANELLEARVQERTTALTASNGELEAFCYSVSHDLRAPLRGIDGFSQALLEDYGSALDNQGKQYLKFVREGIQQMGKLIDDLLNLSRLTRVDMKREPVNLSEIAQATADRLAQQSPERKVQFDVDPDIQVEGDRGLLEAVMENLISNAWKFTARKPDARIELRQELRPEGRVISVRDNGAGFDMAYVSKLFGAFQRLHSPNEFKGTGVGLATVRRVIHRHGGRIWADGEVGRGATFYFTL